MTKSPWFKFLIGLTAGLCAAIFPRLVAALAAAGDPSTITLFNTYYVLLSLGFGGMVGLVVVILESGVPKHPGNTFMMALGIPALLKGGFNTTVGTNSSIKLAEKNDALVRTLEDVAKIPVLPPMSIAPITSSERAPGPQTLAPNYSGEAYAAELEPQVQNPYPWLQMKSFEQRYVIVLDRAATAEDASKHAKSLEKRVLGLQTELVRTDQEVLVIERGRTFTKTDAVLEAIRLKQQALNPQILEVR